MELNYSDLGMSFKPSGSGLWEESQLIALNMWKTHWGEISKWERDNVVGIEGGCVGVSGWDNYGNDMSLVVVTVGLTRYMRIETENINQLLMSFIIRWRYLRGREQIMGG